MGLVERAKRLVRRSDGRSLQYRCLDCEWEFESTVADGGELDCPVCSGRTVRALGSDEH